MSSDAENLKAAAAIMQAFQNQTQRLQGINNNQPPISRVGTNEFDNQGGDFVNPGDGNYVGLGFDNQGPPTTTNLVQPKQPTLQPINPAIQPPATPTPVTQPINTQPAPSTPAASPMPAQTADTCPQCGSMHPPLRPGEKCPNVGIGDAGVKSGITDDVVNKHLVDMRNIIISNMTSKGIRDGKKFFQYAIIELTKALEVYHE